MYMGSWYLRTRAKDTGKKKKTEKMWLMPQNQLLGKWAAAALAVTREICPRSESRATDADERSDTAMGTNMGWLHVVNPWPQIGRADRVADYRRRHARVDTFLGVEDHQIGVRMLSLWLLGIVGSSNGSAEVKLATGWYWGEGLWEVGRGFVISGF
ncbi:hypothetical protein AB1N83_011009 [Pleurotus pulmonarius]